MSEEIVKVPDIGDVSDVEVIELCVAEGEEIKANEPLIVLESDKASMEVPSPCTGTLKLMRVEVGSKVSQGSEIAVIQKGEDSGQSETPAKEAETDAVASAETSDVQAQTDLASTKRINQKVAVPDIGGEQEVEVIEISVKPGDRVEENDTLIVLESDKASMEVPSPYAGEVKGISVKVGDKVAEGTDIAELELESSEPDAQQEIPSDEPTKPASDSEPETDTHEPGSGKTIVVTVPDIGDASDVEVIEVAVAEGDQVAQDDTLVVLESDKASMEIPSPHEGLVGSLLLKVGDKVGEGSPVLELQTSAASSEAESSGTPPVDKASNQNDEQKQEQKPTAPKSEEKPPGAGVLVYAGPAVRMLARELGVDLAKVAPTGPRERILKEDVQNYVKQVLQSEGSKQPSGSGFNISSIPEVDFSQFGEVEEIAMSRVQKLTATAMHRSWLNVPHVTHFDEADITDLEEFRALKKEQASKRGLKLTPLPFLLKACAAALKQHPQFNVSLASSGDALIHKQYCNIGIAMDTPAGLMVPVLRDVDKKGVWELVEEATELGLKGQQGKLKKEDLQGGCFTVSSLGAIGGTGFTPIVNTPEVAILGVSRTQIKPLYLNNEFVPRKMLPLTLSYDHRAINGVDAGKFVTFLTQVLADIRKLVM